MNLQLSSVLLMLLYEGLILVSDAVMVQKWTFVKPVGKVRNRRFYDLVGTVLADVLTVCTQYQVLLNLAILAEGRFQANVVEWSNFVSVGHIFDIMNGPFG
jgi:hypothetical protein